MKIEYLRLVKYKRFALNNIQNFVYRPNLKTQLILGTNGSGKSSLLSELSPLPSKAKDFYEGGFKEIHISHNQHNYILTSHYNNKHSFIKDNVELNPGNTLTVQKNLVYQEFRLNDKIHEILSGKINFCDMNIADRRKWFTELSNTDYQYVLSIYDKVKEKYNQANTELKITRQLIVQEEQKIITDEEINNVKLRLNELNEIIEKLNNLKSHVDYNEQTLINELHNLEKDLSLSTDRLLSLRRNINYNYFQYNKDTDKYPDKKIELSNQLYHIDQELKSKIESHQKLENQLKEVESQKSYDEILNEIKDIVNKQSLLNNEFSNKENIDNIYRQFMSIKDTLINILIDLEENSDLKYSKEKYSQIQEKLDSFNVILNEKILLETKYRRFINDQENALKNHSVECPNCHHEWIPGYNKDLYEKTKVELENILKDISNYEKEKEKYIEYKNKLVDYFNRYKMIMDIFKSYDNLVFIYELLKEHIQNNPSYAINKIHSLETELRNAYDYFRLDQSKKELEDLIKNKKSDIDTFKTNINNELSNLENEINILNIKQSRYKNELDILNQQIQNYTSINKGIEYISKKYEDYNKISKEYLTLKINEAINYIINPLLSETIQLQNTLSSIHSQKNYVESLKSKSLSLEKDTNAYKLLLDILSPKTGIIAESLITFINDIVEYITNLINEVWTYKIEILPIEIENENDSLDYKFSLKVEDNDPIDDISKGSNGIKEIINLAFKICVLFYLDFKGYPLYLDEFGASFDSQHRLNANKIINKLIDDDHFSNIFMISHYEESYGSLNNTDIVVLDSSNITLPKNGFSSVVDIE